jgi:hypothetical protein
MAIRRRQYDVDVDVDRTEAKNEKGRRDSLAAFVRALFAPRRKGRQGWTTVAAGNAGRPSVFRSSGFCRWENMMALGEYSLDASTAPGIHLMTAESAPVKNQSE